MCMYSGYFGPPYSDVIGNLVTGQEVFIPKGVGTPPAKYDGTYIIYSVRGQSAITTCGIRLHCGDGLVIKPLSVIHQKVRATPEVRKEVILADIHNVFCLLRDMACTVKLRIRISFWRLQRYFKKIGSK